MRAVLYEFPADKSGTDRFMHKTAAGHVTVVLIADLADVPMVAREMVAAGCKEIELCGGMPLAVRAKVRRAIPHETRVPSVSFGIESILKAAEFNQAFMEGTPPPEAGIVVTQGADAVTDRYVRRAGAQQVTFVMTDERDAADTARGLAEQGVGLIELYGDFTDETAAAVIEGVAGRAAVGVSGRGRDIARSPAGAMT